jgi:hypothetical protein
MGIEYFNTIYYLNVKMCFREGNTFIHGVIFVLVYMDLLSKTNFHSCLIQTTHKILIILNLHYMYGKQQNMEHKLPAPKYI